MILTVGDSWTYGYGLEDQTKAWPYVLGNLIDMPVHNVSICGIGNKLISENAARNAEAMQPNILIVGWSGVSRIHKDRKRFNLSYVPTELSRKRALFFKQNKVTDLIRFWNTYTKKIDRLKLKNTKVIYFSVFGDQRISNHKKMLDISMLEYLAQEQGIKFKYDIPIFEFGWLHKDNKVAHDFCDRNFNKDWRRACVEREDIRNTKSFLPCGHPTEYGHAVWANYLYGLLK